MKNQSLHYSLILIISFFFHMFLITSMILPDVDSVFQPKIPKNKSFGSRDIIVNINQNNKRSLNNRTLLSDKDSTASGYVTRKKGDRWVNNSRRFQYYRGAGKSGTSSGSSKGRRGKAASKKKIILSDNSHVVVHLDRKGNIYKKSKRRAGFRDQLKIPDKHDVTLQNSIFYTNTGQFSFNTVKFKHFEYFNKMKDKIAENWHPPMMANSRFVGYGGGIRIRAIDNQMVKIYFVLNKEGAVQEVKILDSKGNGYIDQSCLESITMSKKFGSVPTELLKGKDYILIPFIFLYYVR